MSVPSMVIEPCSGLSRPTSDLRKTDLPVPDGPSSTEISPGGRVRVTSLQMFWLPNDLVSPWTSTATPTYDLPCSGNGAGDPAHHDQRASAVCRLGCDFASGRPAYRVPRYWSVTKDGAEGYVCHLGTLTGASSGDAAGAALQVEDGP